MLIIEVSDGGATDWVLRSVEGGKARAMDALNRTAKTAVHEIKADMPAKFTLRSRWAQKGIRSDKANQDDLTARVYSVDPWLLKQEEGETHRPSGHVAIPKGARTSERSLIPRGMQGPGKNAYKIGRPGILSGFEYVNHGQRGPVQEPVFFCSAVRSARDTRKRPRLQQRQGFLSRSWSAANTPRYRADEKHS
ncbi:MAG TPA: hypothetical protein VE954_29015 [Oligoflexus sp.]|uniref:hypothetical protein n=1 Tax=Oligoflexus sp. TaxID=1971216 RepID=UPI002D4C11F2|nr:hypothetical protein [Oligoflexus sp.]HYX37163.1 hypothetical protein [Oligoflexus sp.]